MCSISYTGPTLYNERARVVAQLSFCNMCYFLFEPNIVWLLHSNEELIEYLHNAEAHFIIYYTTRRIH